MKLLAFDTSSSACSVAVQHTDDVLSVAKIASLHRILPLKQAQHIIPMIKEVLEMSSLSIQDLTGIAYGCGPGSFTGIRIASCVAQGIGFAANLPLVPISSLAAIAQTALETLQWLKVLVVVDARMDQVYWACYEVDESGLMQLVGSERVSLPEEIRIPAHWQTVEARWCAVGDGWQKYEQKMVSALEQQPWQVAANLLPAAASMLPMATLKFTRGECVKAAFAHSVYLR